MIYCGPVGLAESEPLRSFNLNRTSCMQVVLASIDKRHLPGGAANSSESELATEPKQCEALLLPQRFGRHWQSREIAPSVLSLHTDGCAREQSTIPHLTVTAAVAVEMLPPILGNVEGPTAASAKPEVVASSLLSDVPLQLASGITSSQPSTESTGSPQGQAGLGESLAARLTLYVAELHIPLCGMLPASDNSTSDLRSSGFTDAVPGRHHFAAGVSGNQTAADDDKTSLYAERQRRRMARYQAFAGMQGTSREATRTAASGSNSSQSAGAVVDGRGTADAQQAAPVGRIEWLHVRDIVLTHSTPSVLLPPAAAHKLPVAAPGQHRAGSAERVRVAHGVHSETVSIPDVPLEEEYLASGWPFGTHWQAPAWVSAWATLAQYMPASGLDSHSDLVKLPEWTIGFPSALTIDTPLQPIMTVAASWVADAARASRASIRAATRSHALRQLTGAGRAVARRIASAASLFAMGPTHDFLQCPSRPPSRPGSDASLAVCATKPPSVAGCQWFAPEACTQAEPSNELGSGWAVHGVSIASCDMNATASDTDNTSKVARQAATEDFESEPMGWWRSLSTAADLLWQAAIMRVQSELTLSLAAAASVLTVMPELMSGSGFGASWQIITTPQLAEGHDTAAVTAAAIAALLLILALAAALMRSFGAAADKLRCSSSASGGPGPGSKSATTGSAPAAADGNATLAIPAAAAGVGSVPVASFSSRIAHANVSVQLSLGDRQHVTQSLSQAGRPQAGTSLALYSAPTNEKRLLAQALRLVLAMATVKSGSERFGQRASSGPVAATLAAHRGTAGGRAASGSRSAARSRSASSAAADLADNRPGDNLHAGQTGSEHAARSRPEGQTEAASGLERARRVSMRITERIGNAIGTTTTGTSSGVAAVSQRLGSGGSTGVTGTSTGRSHPGSRRASSIPRPTAADQMA